MFQCMARAVRVKGSVYRIIRAMDRANRRKSKVFFLQKEEPRSSFPETRKEIGEFSPISFLCSVFFLLSRERVDFVELLPEHDFGVAAHPAIERRGVNLAKVDREFQVAVLQIRKVRQRPMQSAFHGRTD